jgi:hypothetical protein
MESDTRDGHIDADADADAEARGRVLGLDTIQYDTILFDPNRLLRTHEIYIPNRFLLSVDETAWLGPAPSTIRIQMPKRGRQGERGRGKQRHPVKNMFSFPIPLPYRYATRDVIHSIVDQHALSHNLRQQTNSHSPRHGRPHRFYRLLARLLAPGMA